METTQKQVNEFLDQLRIAGKTNMFGAVPYIMKRFKTNKYDAHRFLVSWMASVSQDHWDNMKGALEDRLVKEAAEEEENESI